MPLMRYTIPYERSFGLVFYPFYPKFLANRPPLERNRRFWTDIRS